MYYYYYCHVYINVSSGTKSLLTADGLLHNFFLLFIHRDCMQKWPSQIVSFLCCAQANAAAKTNENVIIINQLCDDSTAGNKLIENVSVCVCVFHACSASCNSSYVEVVQ